MAGVVLRSPRGALMLRRAFGGLRAPFLARHLSAAHFCQIQPLQSSRTTPYYNLDVVSRRFSSTNRPKDTPAEASKPEDEPKLSLFQRFKQMYKEYWYVLLPVHVATSAVWVGIFYYVVSTGVDVVSLLEQLHTPEQALEFIRNNEHAGNAAVIYALYKVATPARYFVTVGGTTYAINKLKTLGYIKPMPNRDQLKEMYEERRDNFKEKMQERKDNLKERMQEQKDSFKQKFKK